MSITKTVSYSYEIMTGCGVLKLSYYFDIDNKFHIQLNMGKSGGCASAQIDTLCRLLNLTINNGVSLNDIRKSLHGITCNQQYADVTSCSDAIAKILVEVEKIHEHTYFIPLDQDYINPIPSKKESING